MPHTRKTGQVSQYNPKKETATHSSTLAWKNPIDRGAWEAEVHGVAKSRTRLSNFTLTLTIQQLKSMAKRSWGVGV